MFMRADWLLRWSTNSTGMLGVTHSTETLYETAGHTSNNDVCFYHTLETLPAWSQMWRQQAKPLWPPNKYLLSIHCTGCHRTVRFPLVVLEKEDADVLVFGVAETTVVVNKWLPLCSSSAALVTLPAKPCIMAQALALSQQIPQLAVGFSLLKAHSSCLAVLQEFSMSDCRSNYASSRTPTPPGGYSPHSPIDRDVPMSPRRRYRSETTIKHSF